MAWMKTFDFYKRLIKLFIQTGCSSESYTNSYSKLRIEIDICFFNFIRLEVPLVLIMNQMI